MFPYYGQQVVSEDAINKRLRHNETSECNSLKTQIFVERQQMKDT